MKKVSIKVAQQLPELAVKLTGAFLEVINNYDDETVGAFSDVIKEIKALNKDALTALNGTGNVASGLVSFIVKNDGSFIKRNNKKILVNLESIREAFNGSEELPDVTEDWLMIASCITVIEPDSLTTTTVDVDSNGEEIKTDLQSQAAADVGHTNLTVITPEQEAIIEEASQELSSVIKEIADEFEEHAKDMTNKLMKKNVKESSLLEDIAVGAAVVVGAVAVGAGLYYAGRAIFGTSDDVFI